MTQKKKVPTMNRQKYVFRNSFSWGNFSGENQGGHHLHICVPRTALKKSLASYLCLAVKKLQGLLPIICVHKVPNMCHGGPVKTIIYVKYDPAKRL